jgi:hypothetical protein
MEADGLFRYLRKNQVEQLKPIREGSCKPNPLSRVEIPRMSRARSGGLEYQLWQTE